MIRVVFELVNFYSCNQGSPIWYLLRTSIKYVGDFVKSTYNGGIKAFCLAFNSNLRLH